MMKTREKLMEEIIYYCVSLSDIMQEFGGGNEYESLYNDILKTYDSGSLSDEDIAEIRQQIEGFQSGTIKTYSVEELFEQLDDSEDSE